MIPTKTCFDCEVEEYIGDSCERCGEWICGDCKSHHPWEKGCFPKKDREWLRAMREFGYQPKMNIVPEDQLREFLSWWQEQARIIR